MRLLLKYYEDHKELPPINFATVRFVERFADLSSSFFVRRNPPPDRVEDTVP